MIQMMKIIIALINYYNYYKKTTTINRGPGEYKESMPRKGILIIYLVSH